MAMSHNDIMAAGTAAAMLVVLFFVWAVTQ